MGGYGSGRKRAPKEVQLVRGERADRVNGDSPEMDMVDPDDDFVYEPPVKLPSHVRAVWDYYAPGLTKARVLAHADLDALVAFCEAVAMRREASHHLDLEGKVIIEDQARGSKQVINPWFRIWKESNADAMRIGARFGLSPADRSALVVPGGKTTEKKDDFADI